MLKKLTAILLAFIILATFCISAYAGQTDAVGNTTTPAIKAGVQQQSPTESAIKSTASSKGAITAKRSNFKEVFSGVLKDGTAVSNEFFVMTITNPEKDKESTYYKSYVLSGNSKYEDVVISIAKYNEDTGEYEPMYNTDGESSWDIGEFRLFSKEIILTEGTNKIKMLAYRTSQKEEAIKGNIQVNCFTIKLLNETIVKKVIKKTAELIGLDKFINK